MAAPVALRGWHPQEPADAHGTEDAMLALPERGVTADARARQQEVQRGPQPRAGPWGKPSHGRGADHCDVRGSGRSSLAEGAPHDFTVGLNAEPSPEGSGRLLHQHGKSVRRRVTRVARGSDPRRFAAPIDQIEDWTFF